MSKKPGHISQEEWDSVDVPEWTEDDWLHSGPASEILPEIVEKYRAQAQL